MILCRIAVRWDIICCRTTDLGTVLCTCSSWGFCILRLSPICLSRRLPCRKKSIKTYVLSILFSHVQHNGLHWHRLLKSIKMDVITVCTVGKIMQLRPNCMYFRHTFLSFNSLKLHLILLKFLKMEFIITLWLEITENIKK